MPGLLTRLSSKNSSRINRGSIAQTGIIPSGCQLIQDSYELKILDAKKTICESRTGKKPVTRVTGIFQEADTRNENGRVYPHDVLYEAVEAIQDDINKRAVFGEYDHPSGARINLDRICMVITKLWCEGKKVFGEAEIIEDLPFGRQMKVLLDHGTIGVSSRGVGDIEIIENSHGGEDHMVLPDYRLITFDCVAQPSVQSAVLKQLAESKISRFNRNSTKPVTQTKQSGLLSRKSYDDMLVNEFDKYLSGK